jgi:hypothetical protein
MLEEDYESESQSENDNHRASKRLRIEEFSALPEFYSLQLEEMDQTILESKFSQVIINTRIAFSTKRKLNAPGEREQWVQDIKALSRWRSTIMDLLMEMFGLFSNFAIGIQIPPSEDDDDDDEEEDDFELSNSIWVPIQTGKPLRFEGIGAVDRADELMRSVSTMNCNLWKDMATKSKPYGVTCREMCTHFWRMLLACGAFMTVDNECESDAAFLPRIWYSSEFIGAFCKMLTGSGAGDGTLSISSVDSITEDVKGIIEEPTLRRYTWGLPDNHELSFTDDEGMTASCFNIEKSDGKAKVHRYFDVPVERAKTIRSDIISSWEELVGFKETDYDDDDFARTAFYAMVRDLLVKMTQHSPISMSMVFTQYVLELDDDKIWIPNEANVMRLTDEEVICGLTCFSYHVRPWGNGGKHSQEMCSLQGVGGAGKASILLSPLLLGRFLERKPKPLVIRGLFGLVALCFLHIPSEFSQCPFLEPPLFLFARFLFLEESFLVPLFNHLVFWRITSFSVELHLVHPLLLLFQPVCARHVEMWGCGVCLEIRRSKFSFPPNL